MPRNGSGVFSLPPTYNPVVNGTTIDPTAFNTTMTDIANALTASVAADGETAVTANLQMNGFKHTGASSATAAGQYYTYGQTLPSVTTVGSAIIQSAYPGSGLTPSTNSLFFQAVNSLSSQVAQAGFQGVFNRILDTDYGSSLLFYTATDNASLERMRIDNNGNVFVGTTAGGAKVNVLNAAASQTLNLTNSSSGSGSTTIAAFTNAVDADFSVQVSQIGAATKFTSIGTSVANPFSLQTAGTIRVTIDGVGRLSGTALHNNGTLPSGTTNQYIASGTYTPTLTNLAGFSVITALTAQWMRVGNVVTVSGEFNATAAASSTVSMGISLPIVSTLGTSGACSGVMPGHNGSTSPGGITGYIKGDTVNNRAQGTVLNDGFNGAGTWGFYFTYVVL